MATFVEFTNPSDGAVRAVKIGMDWRYVVAIAVLLWPVAFGVYFLARGTDDFPDSMGDALFVLDMVDILYGCFLIVVGLLVGFWLGLRGPARRARRYLRDGWEFADPLSPASLCAMRRWQLSYLYLHEC